MYVRNFVVGKLAWDDYVMVAAGCAVRFPISKCALTDNVQNIATMVLFVMAVKYGIGQHIGDIVYNPDGLGMSKLTTCLYYVFVTPSVNVVAQVLTKSSIALTLLRIATQKRYRWTIIGTSIFMVSYLLMFLFVTH